MTIRVSYSVHDDEYDEFDRQTRWGGASITITRDEDPAVHGTWMMPDPDAAHLMTELVKHYLDRGYTAHQLHQLAEHFGKIAFWAALDEPPYYATNDLDFDEENTDE